jgi:hypothetical protein
MANEPDVDIWLRMKNNCKLPIAVVAVQTQAKNGGDGSILEDEIAPNAQGPSGGSNGVSGGILASREQEQIVALFRWPNRTEDEVRGVEEAARLSGKLVPRPRGYGSQSGFDSFRLIVIAPGDQILFSVPSNHVSKTWHFDQSGSLGIVSWPDLSGRTLDESGLTGTMVREYVFFNGQRMARRDAANNAVHYFFSDHLGSTSLVTNATGTMAACPGTGYVSGEQETDYYPYGGEYPAFCSTISDQKFKFTRKEWDTESGLDYFGARHYASTMGRFMQLIRSSPG